MIRKRLRLKSWASMAVIGVLFSLCSCNVLEHLSTQSEVMSVAEEIRLGDKLAARLDGAHQRHDDPLVQAYADALGQRLLERVGPEKDAFDFEFIVIDDPAAISAFALPGGRVYISSGLIMMSESEAELACIIGHEIAHIIKRHIPLRIATRRSVSEGLTTPADSVANSDGSHEVFMTNNSIGRSYLLSFTRKQEGAADAVGLTYAINAGYNPYWFIDFFERIEEMGRSQSQVKTVHPDHFERVHNIRRYIESLSLTPDHNGGETFEQVHAVLWGPNGRPALFWRAERGPGPPAGR